MTTCQTRVLVNRHLKVCVTPIFTSSFFIPDTGGAALHSSFRALALCCWPPLAKILRFQLPAKSNGLMCIPHTWKGTILGEVSVTFETSQRDQFQKRDKFHFWRTCTIHKKKKYAHLSQTTTLEFDTEQSVNVSPLQSHRVLISGAGVRASRWHQMTSRPAATLPCQNISWLAFPAFLALLSKTLRNTQHLTLHPQFFFFLARHPQMAALSPPSSLTKLADPHWPL